VRNSIVPLGQRLQAHERRYAGRMGERFLEPAAPLGEVAAHLPEEPQRARQPQRELGLVVDGPGERGADVVVLGLDPVEPDRGVLAGAARPLGHRLRQLGQPLGVPAPQLGRARLLEALDREVADGLEHREARVAPAQQVVVDERADALQRDVAHALRGLQRAAADEDAEPGEGEALVRPEQVVAPADRRGERALARRRVARPGVEELRLPFQPLEDLRRGEQLRTGRGELDRERQPVEPGADAGHLGRVVLVELEAAIDRPRPG
jgi:hypothetical protein